MKFKRFVRQALFRLAVVIRDVRGLAAWSDTGGDRLTDINIEPSNLCNADCVFCGYQFQERPHAELPIAFGKDVIAAAKRAGAKRLGLTPVVGEPLVNRAVEDLIRAAAAPPHPLRVGLTTNGILLTPERYRSLVGAGLNSICVSMTYPDPAEYKRIYRSARLPKLVANLEGILEIYERHRCDFTLSIRTTRSDWRTHPLFVRAEAAGWDLSNNLFYDDWSGRTTAIMEGEGLWTRPNRKKIVPCSILFSGPHFFSDGRATACGCRDLDGRSDLALDAKLLLDDMHDVYANGAVEGLRQRFRDGDAPAICRSCRHYNAHFAGERLAVRLRQLGADLGIA
jgi:hypothetical protein